MQRKKEKNIFHTLFGHTVTHKSCLRVKLLLLPFVCGKATRARELHLQVAAEGGLFTSA